MSQREEDKKRIVEMEGVGAPCLEHKNYKGKQRPTVPCVVCWDLYIYDLILDNSNIIRIGT
jgi:hypothetical protein